MDEFRDKVIGTLATLGPNGAPIAYAVFLGLYITVCLPTEPIEFLPGFFFGWLKGSLVIIVGKLLGVTLSSIVGRYLFRARIRSFMFRNFPVIKKVSIAIAQEGFWGVVLVRGLALPASVKNYGISSCLDVSLAQNLLASLFMLIPHALKWGWIGDAASTISSNYHEIDISTLMKTIMPDPYVMIALGAPIALFTLSIVRSIAKRVNFDEIKVDDESEKKDQ